MVKNIIVSIASGIILGLVISLVLSNFVLEKIDKPKIQQRIKDFYELAIPQSSITIESIKKESGMYKVLLKVTDKSGINPPNYLEVYVSKDGNLLIPSVIFIKESTEQIKKLKDFVDCLDSKGLKVYGLSNQTATLLQLNILGRYSGRLYVPCDDQQVVNCLNANVSQVPSIVYNGKAYPGVRDINFLSNLTGCTI